jgi:hypothetical protein
MVAKGPLLLLCSTTFLYCKSFGNYSVFAPPLQRHSARVVAAAQQQQWQWQQCHLLLTGEHAEESLTEITAASRNRICVLKPLIAWTTPPQQLKHTSSLQDSHTGAKQATCMLLQANSTAEYSMRQTPH